MPEDSESPCSIGAGSDAWLWDRGYYSVSFPEESRDFDVAAIECWKYDQEEEGRTIPPTKRCEVRGFHTEAMDSWLKEPIPVVNGQQPSAGFKMVVVATEPDSQLWKLTEQQTHAFNAALGLPNSEQHFSSIGSGACGMFQQGDGSHVFILRRNTDSSTISTAVRYNPTTNVTRGVFLHSPRIFDTGTFRRVIDQFMHCSHPLVLPLLTIEISFCLVIEHLNHHTSSLYDVELQTGHGFGRGVGDYKLRTDYRTLVRELGVVQSEFHLTAGTASWCRISAEFIQEKLQHLQRVLPEESRGKLEIPCRMLEERVAFLLSNIECAVVYGGIKERMEAQQTVLFNLIAQSDNLINVGLAKDSKEMAVASKQDSSAMKIIALLTTFFLPGTFIASFFAMPLFDWSEPTLSRVANRHFWVYWAVTGPLTLTTMAGVMAWAVWHNRYVERLQSRARDSVGNNSTDDKSQKEDKNQEPESKDDEGQNTEQTPDTGAVKMGFRQKYSLHQVLNRRKREAAPVEAEP